MVWFILRFEMIACKGLVISQKSQHKGLHFEKRPGWLSTKSLFKAGILIKGRPLWLRLLLSMVSFSLVALIPFCSG